MALGAERQVGDLTEVHERQQNIGYPSDLIVGEAEVRSYMTAMFPDWRAQGVHVCLHEHKGGFANNMASLHGLAAKAKAGRRADGRRRAGDRIRDGRLRRGQRRPHRPGRHRRRAGGGRRRALDRGDLDDARPAEHARRAHAERRRSPRPEHVDVLVPPGGRDRRRSQAALAGGRLDAAGAARRLGRAALRRRGHADHRRVLGQLLQAGPARRAGRCRSRDRRPRVHRRSLSDGLGRAGASPTCGAPRCRTA